MKIAVIGAGGVGGFFGGRLARANDVTFIVRGRTLAALREKGLRVESIDGDFHLQPISATDDPSSVGPVDAVLVAVKAWQLAEAAQSALPLLGPETVVVPLQNGIDAPEELLSLLPAPNVVGGLCAIVSFVIEPGHIRHAGAKPFVMFGELHGRVTPRLEALRDAFIGVGVHAEIPPDIRRSMWTKLLFIAPMSGIGALTRVPIGVWRSLPETRALAERAVQEIIAIATARGIDLGGDALPLTMGRYDGLPPESTSSLQRDVIGGHPSELEAQLGTIVRMAREQKVPAPVLETLYACLLPAEAAARA